MLNQHKPLVLILAKIKVHSCKAQFFFFCSIQQFDKMLVSEAYGFAGGIGFLGGNKRPVLPLSVFSQVIICAFKKLGTLGYVGSLHISL